MSEPEARRLAQERAARRAEGDFPAADELRARIEALGFRVEDRADGFELALLPKEPPRRLRPQDVPTCLDEPPDHDVTVHWLAEGWPQDVVRGIASFRLHEGDRRVQHVVTESVPAPEGPWDTGVEILGLEEALADPAVGIAGPVGAVTDPKLHEFVPAQEPECDAIEGYLMAFRREVLDRGVRFDPGFRFYRSADLEFSFQVKDLGLRAVAVEVPIERHEHRMWWTTPPEDRARWSKRNYYRFLDRWRGRADLTVAGQSSEDSGA
ncbi:MAG: hypothetical protein LC722_05400 [Actinobacteria bacterium]|nr:hypothetical protein [Actinomycetota bacterium]